MPDAQNGHDRTARDLRDCRAECNRLEAENCALRRALTVFLEVAPASLKALDGMAGTSERVAARVNLEAAYAAVLPLSEPAQ